jgi:hypothetical protein
MKKSGNSLTDNIEKILIHAFQSQQGLMDILKTSGCVEFMDTINDNPFLWQSLRPSLNRHQMSQTEKSELPEEPEYHLAHILTQLFETLTPKGVSPESLIVENQFRVQTLRFCISGSISLRDLKNLYESIEESRCPHEKK